jgi:hypothetical protein
MENLEQRWKDVETMLEGRFEKRPDMEGILFLIGINELGGIPDRKFTKEQKQDLMHIAVCSLLSQMGYYEFAGRDEDGWPHFKEVSAIPKLGMKEQEEMLKACIIHYFEEA